MKGENKDVKKDIEFVLPSNEKDKNEQPLSQSIKKQRGIKGKEEVVDCNMKVARSYSSSVSNKISLEDVMKARSSLT